MKTKQLLLPATYRALFELTVLRDEVKDLADAGAATDAERLMRRVDAIEAHALRLLDQFESRRRGATH